MTEFIPGFETKEQAIKAGEKFFAKTNKKKGVFGKDFHLSTNSHGRFHFEDGPAPKVVTQTTSADEKSE